MSTEPSDELPVPGFTATLTPKQAAEACRVSVRTVRRWLAAEQLPGAYRTPDSCWHVPFAALAGRLPTGADATPERVPATTTTSGGAEHELRLELAVERARREAAEQLREAAELLADERGRRADKLEAALESALATLRAQTLQLGPGATPGSLEPIMGAPSPTPTPPAPAPRARWWSRP